MDFSNGNSIAKDSTCDRISEAGKCDLSRILSMGRLWIVNHIEKHSFW